MYYVLGYLNYYSLNFTEIFRSSFIIEDGFLYTGQIPMFAKGSKKGIHFQVVSLYREMLDFEGTQKLYFFCFEKNAYEPILILHDKIVYVGEHNNILVLSYYSIDDPREETGGRVLSRWVKKI